MHLFNKNKLARERLKSKRERTKKEDKNGVSIIRKGSMREESILGHIPKTYVKAYQFFSLCSIVPWKQKSLRKE